MSLLESIGSVLSGEPPEPVADPGLLKLNLGCGNKRMEGKNWVNIDIDPKYADIVADVREVPLPDECAKVVMAIHVLEHLYVWEAEAAVQEWKRLLASEGQLILELPDFVKCCHNVLVAGAVEQEARLRLYGDPSEHNPLMLHRWGWRPEEVRSLLRLAGFKRIKETSPQYHGRRIHCDMRIEARKK